jgi:hypothetical protein
MGVRVQAVTCAQERIIYPDSTGTGWGGFGLGSALFLEFPILLQFVVLQLSWSFFESHGF